MIIIFCQTSTKLRKFLIIRKLMVNIGCKMASEQLCQENQVNKDETVIGLEALVLIRVNNR